MRARLVAATLGVALFGVACTTTLDTDGLEEQIRTRIEERGGPPVTEVMCPEDIEVVAGATFECTATGDGVEWVVQVTQTDDRGKVEIEIAGTG